MPLPWMSRTERRMWHSTTTVTELGGLMARWLEGEIDSRPGQQPRYGPSEETSALIPALAAVCRAGYVTDTSQPGCGPQLGFDGLVWRQRAAVAGVVGDLQLLRRLVAAAEQAGLLVVIRDLLDPPGEGAVPVTTRGAEVHTAMGAALGRDDLDTLWSGCGSQACDAVAAAAQLTLIDPDFAENTRLWDVLSRVAAGQDAPETGDEPDEFLEPPMTECRNCGAPYHGSHPYCSGGCEAADNPGDDEPHCLACGCTDLTPCPGGCWWVPSGGMTDLCSTCAPPAEPAAWVE